MPAPRSDQAALLAMLPVAAASLRLRQQLGDASIRAWRDAARPDQCPPEGDWRTWYIRGGRGGGKTWTGAHTLAEMAQEHPGEYAVVAPTYADARDTGVEGPSGLLAALGTTKAEVDRGASRLVRSWNRSMGDLRLRDGSVIWADGADDGALRIQGKNLRGLWADEVGLWKRWRIAWEESIRYAVRLSPARIVATGTPKRGHPLVKLLMKDEAVQKTLLRTMDNADNLDAAFLGELLAKYGGTTLGRQELEGEVLEDAEGALWKRSLIRHAGVDDAPYLPRIHRDGALVPDLRRIVVAIDPSASADADSDECGIVAAGIDAAGRGWVLRDASGVLSPGQWAQAAVRLYRELRADRILAESNNGGAMVELTIRTADSSVPVRLVSASRGKQARAEPVVALFEQGRVVFADVLPELEDQLCTWEPESGSASPDRLDAMVWALTDLMLTKGWGALSAGDAGGVA